MDILLNPHPYTNPDLACDRTPPPPKLCLNLQIRALYHKLYAAVQDPSTHTNTIKRTGIFCYAIDYIHFIYGYAL